MVEVPITMSSSFQSVNYPDRYIRHKDSKLYIEPIQSELDRKDASFVLVPGLYQEVDFSFRSVNYPNLFLRHQNGRIKLHEPNGSNLFRKDATFKIVPGLYGSGGFSFESINYSGYYIRHSDFKLYIGHIGQSDDSELFRQSATFSIQKGLILDE
ncbi:MAG: AbfB domain-containing protein [Cyanobacteria bacterium P01_H01_bin.35]